MIITTKELLETYGSHYRISQLIKDGKLKRIGHGLYADGNPYLCELEAICARYPNAVLTLESAFAFHGLSDYIPDKYTFATPLNAHRMEGEKISQSFMSNDIVSLGVAEIKTSHGIVRVYDKERMLIELFRLKSKLPPDYYREIVNSYRDLAKNDEIDFRKLQSYCEILKRGKNLRNRIEESVF